MPANLAYEITLDRKGDDAPVEIWCGIGAARESSKQDHLRATRVERFSPPDHTTRIPKDFLVGEPSSKD
jgi:hypothetical protein